MDVGQAIRSLRQKQGLSQRQLADRCFMSSNAISMLEIGKRFPPMGTVERICRAFGVSIAYFLLMTIEERDFPEGRRILFRTSLLPLRDALTEAGGPSETSEQ